MVHIAVSLVRGNERLAIIVSGETQFKAERIAGEIGAPWRETTAKGWRREGYLEADNFEHAVNIAARMEQGAARWR